MNTITILKYKSGTKAISYVKIEEDIEEVEQKVFRILGEDEFNNLLKMTMEQVDNFVDEVLKQG